MPTISSGILRPIVYYDVLQGHSARTAPNICAVFKEEIIHYSTVARWYQRFKAGDISLEDRPRSGRSFVVEEDNLREALKVEPNSTTRELVAALGCTRSTVVRQLEILGYRNVLSSWVPHELRDFDNAESVLLSRCFFAPQKALSEGHCYWC
ncbi:unnamed protein product [Heligmosomoides polygyrus]|uniref:HTH_48 domain-containing protein n=1 Tax=Heligmosomoides polygyrus TaxID=6339 RepID=A0A183FXU9_HELPZ|nr:unnamed protein product [Heligmosomoides polygyrus]